MSAVFPGVSPTTSLLVLGIAWAAGTIAAFIAKADENHNNV